MKKFTYKEQFTKEDGTQVKLTSTLYIDFNSYYSIDTFALTRKDESEDWVYCPEQSSFDRSEIKKMSRAQYLKEGRPPLLVIVGIPKLLSVAQKLLEHAKKSVDFEIKPYPRKIFN